MRNFIKGMLAVTLVLAMTLAVTGDAMAGRGGNSAAGCTGTAAVTSGGCAAAANGTCPVMNGVCPVNIFSGEAVTVTGTVATVLYNGDGMEIDNGTEVVTVYGFGPVRYWEQLGVDRPAVGDAVTVKAYNVTYSDGTVRTIAASVIVDGEEVALRDGATGAPLWRGGMGGGRGCNGGMGGRGYNGACPYVPATE